MNLGADVFNQARRTLTRHGALTSTVAGVWLSAILLALVLPVTSSSTLKQDRSDASGSNSVLTLAEEDHQQFLHGTRWGMSLAEVQRAKAEENGQQTTQSQEIGLLGIVESKGEARVLLRLEDGAVDIHNLGATLPDGRQLDSLGETTLSLKRNNTELDELLLFPEVVSSGIDETRSPEAADETTNEANDKTTAIEPDEVSEGTVPQ